MPWKMLSSMDLPSGGGCVAASAAAAQAHGINRQDVQAAIVKAAELRALHAALLQGGAGGSPAAVRLPAGASPSVSRGASQFTVPEDYPVFTPSYEEDPLPGYHYFHPENRSLSQIWNAIGLEEGKDSEAVAYRSTNKLSASNNELHIPSATENVSNGTSCANHMPPLQASSGADDVKSLGRRTESGEYTTALTNDTCNQETVNMEVGGDRKNLKNAKSTEASHDPKQSVKTHIKHRGSGLSWLFSKSKRKPKPEMSPKMMESEGMSQLLKEWGVLSLESLKKEVLEANENRDAALTEVSEMRSSLGELQQKLVSLEAYCAELKKALKHGMHPKSSQISDRSNLSKRTKAMSSNKDNSMPVSQEVMVEGFLQIVSEARLSVKQFCKMLIHQIEESNDDLPEKLNLLLQPHQMAPTTSKYSKGVIYHLEALVNQTLYQDFENCVFHKTGCPKFLDPRDECRENFSSFVGLRNLSWNEVLQKGTKYYSEDFSRFCDQKLSCIVSMLDWSAPWPEQLLQCFFIAAKCLWLLHLLAFSFSPPLTILRVKEDREFDPLYMEDIPLDRHRPQGATRVKIMVMPGFYVQDRVLKCRVICRHGSVP
ncbi:hypothetical protein MUK42_16027 [Musa troglodytarum]|uniref:GIL1/IRKI C-terminal domain-containing protein n=1 Tax=Musa troglodytarum TaxID=320322 RepID=A0A9E7HPN1_9LILI|nr:hypothetical protein MUK42_16027 [Musa troglodytarum]URE37620.1 hypothetical protein MUK42_16027 [Musa troglodytarum]